jgi:hypothetical protein
VPVVLVVGLVITHLAVLAQAGLVIRHRLRQQAGMVRQQSHIKDLAEAILHMSLGLRWLLQAVEVLVALEQTLAEIQLVPQARVKHRLLQALL